MFSVSNSKITWKKSENLLLFWFTIKKLLRGHQVRQEMTNGETAEVPVTEETTETKNEAEEVIDIDLNDPQTEEAAVKIQVSH